MSAVKHYLLAAAGWSGICNFAFSHDGNFLSSYLMVKRLDNRFHLKNVEEFFPLPKFALLITFSYIYIL